MVGDRDYINYSQIAQLGERQTEDLKVAGSSPADDIFCFCIKMKKKKLILSFNCRISIVLLVFK